MRLLILLIFLGVAIYEINAIPLNPNSPLLHKIKKRDASVAPNDKVSENKTNASPTNSEKNKNVADELKNKPEDVNLISDEEPSMAMEEENINPANEDLESNSDRSIDWQLLSGNPSDLERELETRRRRRSVHSPKSLSRQHRIRTVNRNGKLKKSRSKRDAYYDAPSVSPSDLLTAYAYLQSRRQLEEEDQQPRIELLDDGSNNNGEELANLANLIYELQRSENDGTNDEGEDDNSGEDQEYLPGDYLELEPNNDLYGRSEIRITPEQLAALEQLLSEQQDQSRGDGDDDEDSTGLYPKDKRASFIEPDQDEDDDTGDDDEQSVVEAIDDEEPTYLIPISNIDPSAQYVQIPLSATTYENPYDFYQVDNAPSNIYDDALRRFDEEQLRQRIASLIDDINDQRRLAYRRRR